MRTIAITDSGAVTNGGGLTSPGACEARRVLEAAGFAVQTFAATGTGGREMESAIAAGYFAGVLDLTTSELAEELIGGLFSAGPDRLTAAALRGLPQVVVPGAVDAVSFGPTDELPKPLRDRQHIRSAPDQTLVRTTPQENDRIGRDIAMKISATRGPAAVLLPLRGLSELDRNGEAFWWPEADRALFQSIRNWIAPSVRLVEADLHINDARCARIAADVLAEMVAAVSGL
jgi:uncharacterized protein (UPF0261 family)